MIKKYTLFIHSFVPSLAGWLTRCLARASVCSLIAINLFVCLSIYLHILAFKSDSQPRQNNKHEYLKVPSACLTSVFVTISYYKLSSNVMIFFLVVQNRTVYTTWMCLSTNWTQEWLFMEVFLS